MRHNDLQVKKVPKWTLMEIITCLDVLAVRRSARAKEREPDRTILTLKRSQHVKSPASKTLSRPAAWFYMPASATEVFRNVHLHVCCNC